MGFAFNFAVALADRPRAVGIDGRVGDFGSRARVAADHRRRRRRLHPSRRADLLPSRLAAIASICSSPTALALIVAGRPDRSPGSCRARRWRSAPADAADRGEPRARLRKREAGLEIARAARRAPRPPRHPRPIARPAIARRALRPPRPPRARSRLRPAPARSAASREIVTSGDRPASAKGSRAATAACEPLDRRRAAAACG